MERAEPPADWAPDSWARRPASHLPPYPEPDRLAAAVARLRRFPPLVTSWEVERLRTLLAGAQAGEAFVLQAGDCAETLGDCTAEAVTGTLKIMLQASLVLLLAGGKPVVRIGRLAGQYAKPRSRPVESRAGRELPSYFGDGVNGIEFDERARRPDPDRLVAGYQHAALTLNFVRALADGGFADLHHPEHWEPDACPDPGRRREYLEQVRRITEAIRFVEGVTRAPLERISRLEFFTGHEGLNLHYEAAGTRRVPRRPGYYNLASHFPWIGERTRAPEGAHVEYFRGIRNPVGVKIGPSATAGELLALCERLNPDNEPGRLSFIHRFGAGRIAGALPPLIEGLRAGGRSALWICDPMHGNTVRTPSGVKTRNFDEILEELRLAFDLHQAHGSRLGGVHVELTGEPVTECVGGARGPDEAGLSADYRTPCDPRLNAGQALELAFQIAPRLRTGPPEGAGP